MNREQRPRWEIADVLARTDLAALLDELAQPGTHHIRGRRWHCPMPDHDDHHPSVTVNTDHRGHERWRCWSGDATHRGDAIDLVMATQRLPKADAIDWLANRAGMIPDRPLPPVRRKQRSPAPREVPLSPRVVRYIERCEQMLWTTEPGRDVRRWLHGRGLSNELLRENRIGVDPGADKWLPERKGLPHGDSLAATFPALGRDGEPRYVQARYLDPGEGGDKYDNPARFLGTNPRLGWTRTTSGSSRPGLLVICEGLPDALTAADGGFTAAAILGNQAPDRRIANQLARYAEDNDARLVAVRDHDEGGIVWKDHLSTLLGELGTAVAFIEPPEPGMDLNAWAQVGNGWRDSVLIATRCESSMPALRVQRHRTDTLGIA